ncbi:MAG: 2Fe-2S iron-sulfur cluster-binding protein [Deltaproteobacteria bacterium]
MKYEFLLPIGKNLRKVLIEKGVSPYSAFNNKINCRGSGLCATCGVFVMDSDPTPTHWHDRIARAFGYPRLSCQIEIREDMEIEIPPKWIWGKRKKKERFECCDDLFPRLGIQIIL